MLQRIHANSCKTRSSSWIIQPTLPLWQCANQKYRTFFILLFYLFIFLQWIDNSVSHANIDLVELRLQTCTSSAKIRRPGFALGRPLCTRSSRHLRWLVAAARSLPGRMALTCKFSNWRIRLGDMRSICIYSQCVSFTSHVALLESRPSGQLKPAQKGSVYSIWRQWYGQTKQGAP